MKKTILQAQIGEGEDLLFACKLDQEDEPDAVVMYTRRVGGDGDAYGQESRVQVYMSRAQFFGLCGAASQLAANLSQRLENDARGIPPPAPVDPPATPPAPPKIAGRES